MKLRNRKDYRIRRHKRLRKKIYGTADRPRMSIMKSTRRIYVQFIDDEKGVSIAGMSTAAGAKNVEAAGELGRRAAEVALSKGVKRIVVDRGGFPFHGRIKAVVDAAVGAGLSIKSDKNASAPDNKEEK